MALLQGSDLCNGTPKNLRMDSRPLDASTPHPDLGIGSSSRPAAATPAAPDFEPQPPPAPHLLDRIQADIRVRRYSVRTESACVDCSCRFFLFDGKRRPQDMVQAEVSAFLTHLAVDRTVALPTQNQAKSALLFLYRVVLDVQLPWLDELVASKEKRHLPAVLYAVRSAGRAAQTPGFALAPRNRRERWQRGKDRVTVRPENLMLLLQAQLARVQARHGDGLAEGIGAAAAAWCAGTN